MSALTRPPRDVPARTTVSVHRWDDPVVDNHPMAMPARSAAAEKYWLPLIGPTSLLCARRLVAWLDVEPSIVVDLDVLAAMLGVGARTLVDSRNAPLPRTLRRLCQYGLARRPGDGPGVPSRAGARVSFPALALAAAAVAEVSRYTGIKTPFIDGLDVRVSHRDPATGLPVLLVKATTHAWGYLETQPDGWPLGIHDRSRDEYDRMAAVTETALSAAGFGVEEDR